MKRLMVLLLVLCFWFTPESVRAVSLVDTSFITSRDEIHQYSVLVKDNGSANVFLIVNNLGVDRKGGSYRLTLPEGAIGPVKAWYVDNGIYQRCSWVAAEGMPDTSIDRSVPCYEAIRIWVPIEQVIEEGDAITVTVPKTKGFVSIGMTWRIPNVTQKKWWGRNVNITTPSVATFVSHTTVSVDFPDGVYIRDKAVGPTNWGDMETGVMMSQAGSGMEAKTAFVPEMFDRIGGAGDVVKGTSNLAPGETYSFSLLTATARWKLFVPEIATMLGVSVTLALVVSLLLRLLIGRKPFWWYLAVVTLLLLLAGMTVWLLRMYTALFPRSDYPLMYEKTRMLDGGGEMMPQRLDQPVTVEGGASGLPETEQ